MFVLPKYEFSVFFFGADDVLVFDLFFSSEDFEEQVAPDPLAAGAHKNAAIDFCFLCG